MRGRKPANITGQRFGRLITVKLDHTVPRRGAFWLCRCDCGTEAVISLSHLRAQTSSCGCLWRETMRKHGHAARGRRSSTYTSWSQMIGRCTNPRFPRYADWGGRGITVCDRWRDFASFLADMGERPPGTTLGRISNDEGYEPGNCRWETPPQQSRNKKNTKLTWDDVAEIYKTYAAGGVSQRELGRRYAVSHSAIRLALNAYDKRETYRGLFR